MSSRNISILVIMVLSGLVAISNAGTIPRNNFHFLGKFTKITTDADNRQSVQQSYYFLSQNAAGWSTAATDCRNSLDESATLLFIETAEEQAEVIKQLQSSDDTGATYWTGGKYDPTSAAFVWDSGVPLLATAPWAAGHPTTQTPVTRVLISKQGGAVSLKTDFQTVSLRYICELTV